MKAKQDIPAGADERAKRLLAQKMQSWRGLEPRPDFEARVWRRLAAAAPAPAERWIRRGWFDVSPAWAGAAAVLVAVVVGVAAARWSPPPLRNPLAISAPALQDQTLTGNYLALVTGGAR